MSQQAAPVRADSRIEPRFPATAVPTITAVRLSPGDTVELVDISRSGVLVEGSTRFVPGTRITVHFDGGFCSRPDEGQGRPQPRVVDQRTVCCAIGRGFSSRSGSKPIRARWPWRCPCCRNPPGALSTEQAASAGVAAAAAPVPRRVVNRW